MDVERRIDKVEARQDAVDMRLEQGGKTMAGHEIKLRMLCDYQDKQNGSLQRLEDRFNSFYNLLIISLLGMVANLVITIVRR